MHYLGARKLEQLAADIQACDVGVIPNQRNAFTDINTSGRMSCSILLLEMLRVWRKLCGMLLQMGQKPLPMRRGDRRSISDTAGIESAKD